MTTLYAVQPRLGRDNEIFSYHTSLKAKLRNFSRSDVNEVERRNKRAKFETSKQIVNDFHFTELLNHRKVITATLQLLPITLNCLFIVTLKVVVTSIHPPFRALITRTRLPRDSKISLPSQLLLASTNSNNYVLFSRKIKTDEKILKTTKCVKRSFKFSSRKKLL